MDFVHVLNLLLRETAAPSRTFSTFIWSLAAQSSRRTAQSLFNHGDRFKSTFWKVQPGTELGIKTPQKKNSWLRYTGRSQPQLAPVLLDEFQCIWSSLIFPCLYSPHLLIFLHQFPLTAGLPSCCTSSCPATLHRPFLCRTKQKCSNASSKCTYF